PEDQRKAVWAIYAVCRKIDDSIDVYGDIKFLNQIKEDIQSIEKYPYEHHHFQSNRRIMMALQHVAQHKNIAFQSFYNLIDTVYKDQHFTMFETDAELFGYCYGVAGTVGEVLTPILSDHETHQTYDVARRLGESLQLINILRDVGEDFENERIYFSKQRLKQYEVDIAEVYQNGVNNHYIDLWEYYAAIAEKDFRDVMDQIKVFSIEAQPIIELAARIYIEILDEVRQANYTLHERIFVDKRKKAKLFHEINSKYHII
ncbi:4,4'-diapophytoene synthase CrtM, partial [Staphylococcus aureus]